MLARFGPALLGVLVFLMPAVVLAVDHKELNASPPDDFAPLADLLALKVPFWVDVREGLENWGAPEAEGDGWIWTEV